MSALPISGTAVPLRHGAYAAEIASVGATLRSLTHDGRDLVAPFAQDELRPVYRGVVLAPWPNRVVDGRYAFDGQEQQLPLTEPDRGHALHGLVCWSDFRVVHRATDAVTLTTDVVAQAGYPHPLRVEVEHRLADDGLRTRITTTNTGDARAPYGASGHPYLVAGPGRVDDWTLELAADRVLEVDERLVPTGLGEVAGGPFDFAAPRRIGDLFIDHAFTGLRAHRARVIAADGRGTELRWDAVAPWVQVHTADRPEPALNRAGLAVEPMTCPPDAFNSGTDLVVLEPGASHAVEWTIEAV
ncbi:aldose 1-epimerase family protein [Amnibacterium kyonggiense]|uniref:Aldose 1-epimerase n=1 Tax=Amnibacterium kyonggiense TaxID=595671 RepID=A0A4R7FS53_9MICO|nr:aldose 1-epimerase family protein [Amnibacterium kyonggiense]TDS80671.1 aldose 1-epimerase [Amnibacterium kyonggiense]